MNIELSEMMRLKGRLTDINSELVTTFNSVNSELQSISDNVNSSGLHGAVLSVQDKIEALSSKLSSDLQLLEEFMDKQLTSYTVTNEEASQSLKKLVETVQQRFDANGNIISITSKSIVSESFNNQAKPVIADQSGYDNGAKYKDVFASKIGNSDKKWEIVDKTYYYFKEKGLSDEQIAGILGNMTQESALELDARSSSGKYRGLFQWSKSRQPENFDLQSQLDRAWNEISSERGSGAVIRGLQNTSTVEDSTYSFAETFEGYTGEMKQRRQYAYACYYHIKNDL